MGRTNRDRVKDRQLDDEGDHPTLRKETKKKQKRNRRNREKDLKDAVVSGAYDGYEFDDDYFSDDEWDG